MAINQKKQAMTGISEGVWMNMDYLEEKALIHPEFEMKMMEEDGFLNLPKLNADVELRKYMTNIKEYDGTIKKLEKNIGRSE